MRAEQELAERIREAASSLPETTNVVVDEETVAALRTAITAWTRAIDTLDPGDLAGVRASLEDADRSLSRVDPLSRKPYATQARMHLLRAAGMAWKLPVG